MPILELTWNRPRQLTGARALLLWPEQTTTAHGMTYSGWVPKDLLPAELRTAEREIDSQYLANPLVRLHFAEAGWYFLAFCDEFIIRDMIRQDAQTVHENAAITDNLVVHSKWPLRWLWQTCPPKRGHSSEVG